MCWCCCPFAVVAHRAYRLIAAVPSDLRHYSLAEGIHVALEILGGEAAPGLEDRIAGRGWATIAVSRLEGRLDRGRMPLP